jgi:SAM-dependent methyltransferase
LNNNLFNNLASEYDAWFDQAGKPVFEIELEALRKILPDLPKPWLEIGAGSGRFAKALGIETGLEPSIEMAKIARRRGINTFWCRGEQKVFEENSFGTVFLITTLCFLDDPLDVLKEARRILVPGGKIVLGVITKDSPWGQYYEKKKLEGHPVYKYTTFYQCREIAQFTLLAGFTGERIISTLFQKPDEVRCLEEPKEGFYSEAGFVIFVAVKPEESAPFNSNLAQDNTDL